MVGGDLRKAFYERDVERDYALIDELSGFKRRLGLQALKNLDLPLASVLLLQGISFYQCWEHPLILSYFDFKEGVSVLDVGGRKSTFPLHLRCRGCEVHVVDIDPRVVIQEKYARYLGKGEWINDGFYAYVQDATATEYPSDFFDVITAISSAEHFPGDGDIEFAREASRILKPGGRLFLSFGVGEYSEWRWEWLFCRTYDERALHKRIIEPSGLTEEARMYFEGSNTRRFTERWFRLPRVIRNGVLGWMQVPLYKRLYHKDEAGREGLGYYMGLILRKD